jgi:hypothetical protein
MLFLLMDSPSGLESKPLLELSLLFITDQSLSCNFSKSRPCSILEVKREDFEEWVY